MVCYLLVHEEDVVEVRVVYVFYENPLQVHHTTPFGLLPPETEGLGEVYLRNHLSNTDVLVTVYDGKKEVDWSFWVSSLAANICLVQSVIVLLRTGPNAVLYGLMEVIIIRASDDEEVSILDVVRPELWIMEVAQGLELLLDDLQIGIIVQADHWDVQILVSSMALRLLYRRNRLLVHHIRRKRKASRKLHGS